MTVKFAVQGLLRDRGGASEDRPHNVTKGMGPRGMASDPGSLALVREK